MARRRARGARSAFRILREKAPIGGPKSARHLHSEAWKSARSGGSRRWRRRRRSPSPSRLCQASAEPRTPWRRRLAAPLAALVAFFAKFKALLLLLPKLKLLTTSGTMLVSVAAYSLIWGWKFAVGFVLLLLVHEMGHVIQLRREGIEASAPMFIPFLGAVVAAKSLRRQRARRGARRARRPGPRLPGRRGAARRRRRDRQRLLDARSRSPASS